jgi:hypothetical protein
LFEMFPVFDVRSVAVADADIVLVVGYELDF